MKIRCLVYLLVCAFALPCCAMAGREPELVEPVDALELYRRAAGQVMAFSDEAKAGLASCPGCLPSPGQVRAALRQANAPLRLLKRANAAPGVDWQPPERLGPKNQMAVRPEGLVALGTLSLLRAEARFEEGEVAGALDDLHNSAILAVRLAQPTTLHEALKQLAIHKHWQRVVAANVNRFDGPARQRVLAMTQLLAEHGDVVPNALGFEREHLVGWTLEAEPQAIADVGLTPMVVKLYYAQVYTIEAELMKVLRQPADRMYEQVDALIERHQDNVLIKPLVPGFVRGRGIEYLVQSRLAAIRAELLRRSGQDAQARDAVQRSPFPLKRAEDDGHAVWRVTVPEPIASSRPELSFTLRMPLD